MLSEEKMTERILNKVDMLQEDMSDVKVAMEKIVAVAEKQAEDREVLRDHEKRIKLLEHRRENSQKKRIWDDWTPKQTFIVAILGAVFVFAAIYGVIDLFNGETTVDENMKKVVNRTVQDQLLTKGITK